MALRVGRGRRVDIRIDLHGGQARAFDNNMVLARPNNRPVRVLGEHDAVLEDREGCGAIHPDPGARRGVLDAGAFQQSPLEVIRRRRVAVLSSHAPVREQ